MSETLAARAQTILHNWVQSESLRKHCYAVADSMKHFAHLRGENADLWEAVGLLHDMDYERHPNLERSASEGHLQIGWANWLPEPIAVMKVIRKIEVRIAIQSSDLRQKISTATKIHAKNSGSVSTTVKKLA